MSSDDDGAEAPICVGPKGRKSRAKNPEPRVWYEYDDTREKAHEQLCVKMCFKDAPI